MADLPSRPSEPAQDGERKASPSRRDRRRERRNRQRSDRLEELAYRHLSRAVDEAGPELSREWMAYADPDLKSLRRPGSSEWDRLVQRQLEETPIGRNRPPERPWGDPARRVRRWLIVGLLASLALLTGVAGAWSASSASVIALLVVLAFASWRTLHGRREGRRATSTATGAVPQSVAARRDVEAARSRAIAALRHGADPKQLVSAATDLAAALREAAHDDGLWPRSSEVEWAKFPERAEMCRQALDVDWDQLTRHITPSPPPPSVLLTAELVEAATAALDGRAAGSVNETRQMLRMLADALEKPGPRLTAQLRRAVRVTARLPALQALARDPGSMTAHFAFILGLSAPQLLSATTREDLSKLLSEGARGALATILERLAAEVVATEDVDPADRAAHVAVTSIDNFALGRWLENWRTVALLEADTEAAEPAGDDKPPRPQPRPTAAISLLRESTLHSTREIHMEITSALDRLWDEATGAPWANPEFDRLTEELAAALRAIRVELDRPDGPDAGRMSNGVQRLVEKLHSTQALVGRAIPHPPASDRA